MDLYHELTASPDSLSANFYWGRGLGSGGAPVHGKFVQPQLMLGIHNPGGFNRGHIFFKINGKTL